MATGAAVSVLALGAALVQPKAGRALDAGRITASSRILVGLLATAAGLGSPRPGVVLPAAVLIGACTGLITPLGFAALAASTPEARFGQTMGAAELGGELGDAGGALLVATLTSVSTLTSGYAAPALAIAALAAPIAAYRAQPQTEPGNG
ncbi:MFS transporter [Streptomyces sp. YGL11-2]|uniref:MFS transporter n=1 Tax=Streptomyces sp. YGL11-2 TaxID=3414028 RepID=UPI003CFB659E